MSPWFSDMFLSSQSDQRLVRLAQAGHQQALAVIVQRYRRELIRFAHRLGADGRAEDVVQQTFLSALDAFQSGTEVTHLRGWLYTILRHHAARLSEPAHAEVEMAELAAAGAPVEEAVGQRLFAIEALSEINRLPDRQRTALVATALEGRSREEVAGLLGLSEGAVRQLVFRARATVRASVTAITPFPLLRWLVARQPHGSDWSTADMVAGAGGASTVAVAVKVGAVVVAGLGVAGAIAVRPQPAHPHHTPGATTRAAAGVQGGSAGQATSGALGAGPAAGQSARAVGTAASAAFGGLARSGSTPEFLGGRSVSIHRNRPGSGGSPGVDGGSGPSGSDGGDHGGSAGGSGPSDGAGSGHDGGSTAVTGASGGGSGSGSGSGSDGGTSGSGSSGGGGGSSDGGSSGSSPTSSSSDGGSGSSPDGSGGGTSSDGGSSDGGSTLPNTSTSGG
ncbi:MAG TPA: RNA polymerase sigma factor [Solirubrobacteraceae bacterium]|nr:RNA polymerase sigma factor [Solirubrobacteraceae bacterium]